MRFLVAFVFVFFSLVHFTVVAQASSDVPTHVVVSLDGQSLTVYSGTKVLVSSNISSGRAGYETPTGIFSIIQKRRRHFSNIYDNAPMPHMQRLTWSGIALHGSGHVPRYAASHGCVRLPHNFARKLFRMTRMGAHVVVARDAIAPRPIYHGALFQPERAGSNLFASLRDGTGTDVALSADPKPTVKKNMAPLRILITRDSAKDAVLKVQQMLNELGWEAGPEDGLMGRMTRDAIKRYQSLIGIETDGEITHSLLTMLSKVTGRGTYENGRIFVRQNFKPLFDAPVVLKDPEKPLGAHLISAIGQVGDSNQLEWVFLSLKDKLSAREAKRLGVEAGDFSEAQPISDVLSRIEVPADVRMRIEALITPGTSISISDKGVSHETSPGPGTDFIVLTRG